MDETNASHNADRISHKKRNEKWNKNQYSLRKFKPKIGRLFPALIIIKQSFRIHTQLLMVQLIPYPHNLKKKKEKKCKPAQRTQ